MISCSSSFGDNGLRSTGRTGANGECKRGRLSGTPAAEEADVKSGESIRGLEEEEEQGDEIGMNLLDEDEEEEEEEEGEREGEREGEAKRGEVGERAGW